MKQDKQVSTTDERIEQALAEMGRAHAPADLSSRIIATLPKEAKGPSAGPWLGVATLLAAMFGFALAYQTAFTLRSNGAFELVSYYTTQPEIVTTYPNQAWDTLAGSVPWMTLAITLVMLTIALILTYRWTAQRTARAMG